jgi:lipid-binding SYLF domain-containing protein
VRNGGVAKPEVRASKERTIPIERRARKNNRAISIVRPGPLSLRQCTPAVLPLARSPAPGHFIDMRVLIASWLLTGFVCSAMAVDKAELDYRIRKLAIKLDALQSKPDKRIPAETLRKAQGIVLLDRTKAGFIFAYQGGSGIALAKDPRTGQWGAPAFLRANEASFGFQIGGQQSFVVILLMNTNAVQSFAEGTFKFGGEASGTAGSAGGGVEGTVSNAEPLMLVYTDREGLYGGAAVKGDAISPDTDADIAYYGQYLTMREILLEHKVQPAPTATELTQKLMQYSK